MQNESSVQYRNLRWMILSRTLLDRNRAAEEKQRLDSQSWMDDPEQDSTEKGFALQKERSVESRNLRWMVHAKIVFNT